MVDGFEALLGGIAPQLQLLSLLFCFLAMLPALNVAAVDLMGTMPWGGGDNGEGHGVWPSWGKT